MVCISLSPKGFQKYSKLFLKIDLIKKEHCFTCSIGSFAWAQCVVEPSISFSMAAVKEVILKDTNGMEKWCV